MNTNDSVIKFLREHHYIPIVRRIEGGCLLTLPHPALSHPGSAPYSIAFSIWGGGCGLLCRSSREEAVVRMPDYAYRVYITLHVLEGCAAVPISADTVLFLDGDGGQARGIAEVFDSPADPAAEDALWSVLNGDAAEAEEAARRLNVSEGFEVCRTFLRKD